MWFIHTHTYAYILVCLNLCLCLSFFSTTKYFLVCLEIFVCLLILMGRRFLLYTSVKNWGEFCRRFCGSVLAYFQPSWWVKGQCRSAVVLFQQIAGPFHPYRTWGGCNNQKELLGRVSLSRAYVFLLHVCSWGQVSWSQLLPSSNCKLSLPRHRQWWALGLFPGGSGRIWFTGFPPVTISIPASMKAVSLR